MFTADQQLYHVMVNVLWVHPEMCFPTSFHGLEECICFMSFVGCVGTLMTSSALEEVLKSAFGGVPRMLTGKTIHRIPKLSE